MITVGYQRTINLKKLKKRAISKSWESHQEIMYKTLQKKTTKLMLNVKIIQRVHMIFRKRKGKIQVKKMKKLKKKQLFLSFYFVLEKCF